MTFVKVVCLSKKMNIFLYNKDNFRNRKLTLKTQNSPI